MNKRLKMFQVGSACASLGHVASTPPRCWDDENTSFPATSGLNSFFHALPIRFQNAATTACADSCAPCTQHLAQKAKAKSSPAAKHVAKHMAAKTAKYAQDANNYGADILQVRTKGHASE